MSQTVYILQRLYESSWNVCMNAITQYDFSKVLNILKSFQQRFIPTLKVKLKMDT